MAKAQSKTAAQDAVVNNQDPAVAPGLDQGQKQQPQDEAPSTLAPEAQAPALAGAASEGAQAGAAGLTAEPEPEPEPERHADVRVLAAVTIGGERFQPNDVIEGVPQGVVEAYAGSVDPHPDAVAYARSMGAPVKPCPGQAHAED